LVLFEMLADFYSQPALEIPGPAERLALVRLHGALEKTLVEPFMPDFQALGRGSAIKACSPIRHINCGLSPRDYVPPGAKAPNIAVTSMYGLKARTLHRLKPVPFAG
jgi:hypothetical protein